MSNQRRSKSLYANLSVKPLTPQSAADAVIIKIVPDTKIEAALYKMLLQEKRKTARLLAEIAEMRQTNHEYKLKRMVRPLARQLKPSHNENPKGTK